MKVPECSSIASSRNDWDICLVYFDFLLCCRDYLHWKKILISEELQILFKYKKQSSSFNLLVCCWWLLPFKFIVLNIRMQIFKFTDPRPYSWGQVCRMWDELWLSSGPIVASHITIHFPSATHNMQWASLRCHQVSGIWFAIQWKLIHCGQTSYCWHSPGYNDVIISIVVMML